MNRRLLRMGVSLFLLFLDTAVSADSHVEANEAGTPFGDTGVVLRMSFEPQRTGDFRSYLNGDEEGPPVETQAQGQATFSFDDEAGSLTCRPIVANIHDVFAAHIHCAPAGVNGSVGVTPFESGPHSPNGALAGDTVEEPDATNARGWDDLTDVLHVMQEGNAYVNVHSAEHEAGEIRGQIL